METTKKQRSTLVEGPERPSYATTFQFVATKIRKRSKDSETARNHLTKWFDYPTSADDYYRLIDEYENALKSELLNIQQIRPLLDKVENYFK